MALPPAESAEAFTNLWEEADPQWGGARGHLLSQVCKDHTAHSAWGSSFRGGALGTCPKAGPGWGGRKEKAAGDQSRNGHLLRDHLLDLWLHVSVHCFSCRGGEDGDENQSPWELPGK